MSESKKYFWLKLKDNFFEEKYTKALRKLPEGDKLVIVYLKMQLKSLKTEGILKYEQIMPSKEEELALLLDEDVTMVSFALKALANMKLIEVWDNETVYMTAMQELIGSETTTAARVRKHRAKQKLLQCNTDETTCNTEIEKEIEIDIDIDIDKRQLENDIDLLWSIYPNKKGKGTAIKKLPKLIKTFGVKQLERCINRYIKEIKENNISKQYIKHGSTFFNNGYIDYLDENYQGGTGSEKSRSSDTSSDNSEYDESAITI